MSATVPDRVDVVVVGAGPVGCALSLLLGARGRSVLVVERHTGPYPLPRAVHFDDETARILQACGLGDELPAPLRAGHDLRVAQRPGRAVAALRDTGTGPAGLAVGQHVQPARPRGPALRPGGGHRGPLASLGPRRRRRRSGRRWCLGRDRAGGRRRPPARRRVLRRGLRRCQQYGARPARPDLRRPGLLLRLAGRGRRPPRAAGLRPPEPPGVRPPPAHHRGLGRTGPATLGVHVPSRRDPRDARRGGRRVGVPRALGRPPRQRHDGPPRRIPLPRPVGDQMARGSDLRGR